VVVAGRLVAGAGGNSSSWQLSGVKVPRQRGGLSRQLSEGSNGLARQESQDNLKKN
jgi:hypothetical protein